MDFVVGIFDLLVYWRVGFGVALTGLACWLILMMVPNDPARWIICVPLGLIGIFFAFRWQNRADLDA